MGESSTLRKFGGNFGRGKGGIKKGRGEKKRIWKREARKMENGEEKKGNCKREGGKLNNWVRERYENEQRTFFFFCLSLFETTEICLVILGQEKIEKCDFAASEKIFLLRYCI